MTHVDIGASKWTKRALDAVDNNVPFILSASGWRARRIIRHMPRLMDAAGDNPAMIDFILLFGLNRIYFHAVARSYHVRMVNLELGRIQIEFTPPGAKGGVEPFGDC